MNGEEIGEDFYAEVNGLKRLQVRSLETAEIVIELPSALNLTAAQLEGIAKAVVRIRKCVYADGLAQGKADKAFEIRSVLGID